MSKPATVEEYLAQLTDERREALGTLRKTILANLDPMFEEGLQYGMIGYYVPHSIYPNGYHCDPKQPVPFAGIASQKNHIGLHLYCVYTTPDLHAWFVEAWKNSGKKLDMGKACVRVKNLDGVPLDVIAQLFKRAKAKAFLKTYEANLRTAGGKKPAK